MIKKRTNIQNYRLALKAAVSIPALLLCGGISAQAVSQELSTESNSFIVKNSTSLEAALLKLAREQDVTIFASAKLTKDKSVSTIGYAENLDVALKQLLINTNLTFEQKLDGTYVVFEKSNVPKIGLTTTAEYEAELGVYEGDERADEVDGFQLDEIVVTSRRRAENLQSTPLAISAFSANALQNQGIENISDLQGKIPNVAIGGAGGTGATNSSFTIRGMGQPRNAISAEAGVALYVDGVYLGRSEGGLLGVLDVERIEILKGPQGTLFGKNAVGGAISYVTAKPEDEFGGKVGVTYGAYDRLDIKANMNIPLSDTLFLKLAAASIERDGHVIRNSDGLDTGDQNSKTLRGSLLWVASDSVSVNLVIDASTTDTNGSANILLDVDSTAVFPNYVNANLGGAFDDNRVDSDMLRSNGTGPAFNTYDGWGSALNIDWDISDDLSLKSITSYRAFDFTAGIDLDGAPETIWHQNTTRSHKQYSQEFQLSGTAFDEGLNWVTGLYYYYENPTDDRTVDLGIPGASDRTSFEQTTSSYAAFAQGSYQITEKLSTTLGARYGYETKDIAIGRLTEGQDPGRSTFPDPNGSLLTDNQKAFNNDSWANLSLRAGLEYQATDDIMIYTSFARGYKSGGFSDRLRPNPNNNAITPYDEEKNETYELGFRGDLLEGRLRANMTYFHSVISDIQLTAVGFVDGARTQRTYNGGTAKTDGIEADLTFLVTEGFTANASFGYMDARYTYLADDVSGITLDSIRPRTPKFSYVLGAEYEVPLANEGTITLRADYAWMDDFTLTADTEAGKLTQKSYGLLNARIIYDAPDGQWSVALFGSNLTDERYLTSGLGFGTGVVNAFGLSQGDVARPREWGVTVSVNF